MSARWEEVRKRLNRLLRGWGGYFSPGSHYVADGVIDAPVYDRVRNFLTDVTRCLSEASDRSACKRSSATSAC